MLPRTKQYPRRDSLFRFWLLRHRSGRKSKMKIRMVMTEKKLFVSCEVTAVDQIITKSIRGIPGQGSG
jgi:hypothetical protein